MRPQVRDGCQIWLANLRRCFVEGLQVGRTSEDASDEDIPDSKSAERSAGSKQRRMMMIVKLIIMHRVPGDCREEPSRHSSCWFPCPLRGSCGLCVGLGSGAVHHHPILSHGHPPPRGALSAHVRRQDVLKGVVRCEDCYHRKCRSPSQPETRTGSRSEFYVCTPTRHTRQIGAERLLAVTGSSWILGPSVLSS